LWKLLVGRMRLSKGKHVPGALRQKGRAADQLFPAEEGLYIRFRECADGYVDVSELPAADLSVNRSKYCKRPEWVLLARFPKYLDFGYGVFTVADIPTPIKGLPPEYVRYDFVPRHIPEANNYSHSEIKVYRWQNYVNPLAKKQVTNEVKLRFRMLLRPRIRIIKPPKEQGRL
jgi:hypothetical protein